MLNSLLTMIIDRLKSTLGGMSGKDADKVVGEQIEELEKIRNFLK